MCFDIHGRGHWFESDITHKYNDLAALMMLSFGPFSFQNPPIFIVFDRYHLFFVIISATYMQREIRLHQSKYFR